MFASTDGLLSAIRVSCASPPPNCHEVAHGRDGGFTGGWRELNLSQTHLDVCRSIICFQLPVISETPPQFLLFPLRLIYFLRARAIYRYAPHRNRMILFLCTACSKSSSSLMRSFALFTIATAICPTLPGTVVEAFSLRDLHALPCSRCLPLPSVPRRYSTSVQ